MKKLIYLVVILILAFTFTACSGNDVANEDEMSVTGPNGEEVRVDTSDVDMRYVEYSADSACKLIQTSMSDNPMDMMTDVLNFEDYGLTAEEVAEYPNTYQNNEAYALLAYDRMRETCGDEMDTLGIQEFPQ